METLLSLSPQDQPGGFTGLIHRESTVKSQEIV